MLPPINKKYLEKIAQKVLNHTATQEEQLLLNSYYNYFEKEENVSDEMTGDEKDSLKIEIRNALSQKLNENPRTIKLNRFRLVPTVAAAAILIIISVSSYFLFKKPVPKQTFAKTVTKDIPGGVNKAILTIGNGPKIILDDVGEGSIAKNADYIVNKTSNGQVIFKSLSAKTIQSITYNTLSTPKGAQYKLVLPDGTKVWLNAASSIRFPTTFIGHERIVDITGEAYFEVEPNKKMPFKVSTAYQTIEVLGTHFNVNAYDDEKSTKTTLLEGKVKIAKGTRVIVLKPGQQSVVQDKLETIAIQEVDTEIAVAWKNGYFNFEGTSTQELLLQLSRWYDIEIVYEGKIDKDEFFGKIPRSSNLSKAIKILEMSNVQCRLEGRKLIIIP